MESTRGECPTNYGKDFIDFKSFLKEELSTFKEEIREEFSGCSEKSIRKFQETASKRSPVDFKYKGNKRQYDFNCKVLEDIERVQSLVKSGGQLRIGLIIRTRGQLSSLQLLESTVQKIHKRNKLVRLADKSLAGWGTVAEYESDDLASDSDDDRKIRRAEARALSKKRKLSSSRASATNSISTTSSQFETFRPFRRVQCFACAGFGHVRAECPKFQQSSSFQGQRYRPVPDISRTSPGIITYQSPTGIKGDNRGMSFKPQPAETN
ncbi:uncharacterized protein LOC132727703 [Ruditapes philippinarum]|uniref:uncharacterized protein LOC132727703 n=1 Tax=Ruditapes philippinarum TaxID=129788 RepID=UPI00295A5DF1|nr:uncharacterized protein LOC132727703 [Ruditapes philippinarum]